MNIKSIGVSIRNRFKTLVSTPKSLPTQYDNLPFERPEDSLYCRLAIRPGDSSRVSVGSPGNNRFRQSGIWVASLFEPIERGEDTVVDLADFISRAFVSQGSYQGVTFRAPSITKVGRAGKYWQVNVTCEWYSDYIG